MMDEWPRNEVREKRYEQKIWCELIFVGITLCRINDIGNLKEGKK